MSPNHAFTTDPVNPQEDRVLNILYREIDRYLEGRGGTTPMAEHLTNAIVADGVILPRHQQQYNGNALPLSPAHRDWLDALRAFVGNAPDGDLDYERRRANALIVTDLIETVLSTLPVKEH